MDKKGIEARESLDSPFLTEQILTYLGNKRRLLPYLAEALNGISKDLGSERLSCADMFSGSGIVARLMKGYSSVVTTNDLEDYSKVVNDCYMTNAEDFDEEKYERYAKGLEEACGELHAGVLAENYAPKDDSDVKKGERVFYTTRNAMYLDTAMDYVFESVDEDFRKFFVAPLLYEASVHANTAGVFKGFYKNAETGIGQYGGNGRNRLDRILADVQVRKPVFSKFSAKHVSLQGDANEVARTLEPMDVAYLDPPYNQHGYGSNYFMLNAILRHEVGENLSEVSGIPSDWNRSGYNRKRDAANLLFDLAGTLRCKYLIVSYNDEGFVTEREMEENLGKLGELTVRPIRYPTYRGSRNLRSRSKYVNEYLFVLKKR